MLFNLFKIIVFPYVPNEKHAHSFCKENEQALFLNLLYSNCIPIVNI